MAHKLKLDLVTLLHLAELRLQRCLDITCFLHGHVPQAALCLMIRQSLLQLGHDRLLCCTCFDQFSLR